MDKDRLSYINKSTSQCAQVIARNRIFIRNFPFIFMERGRVPVWIKWNLSIYVHSSPFVVTCRFRFSFQPPPPLSVIHKSLCDNRNLNEILPFVHVYAVNRSISFSGDVFDIGCTLHLEKGERREIRDILRDNFNRSIAPCLC